MYRDSVLHRVSHWLLPARVTALEDGVSWASEEGFLQPERAGSLCCHTQFMGRAVPAVAVTLRKGGSLSLKLTSLRGARPWGTQDKGAVSSEECMLWENLTVWTEFRTEHYLSLGILLPEVRLLLWSHQHILLFWYPAKEVDRISVISIL